MDRPSDCACDGGGCGGKFHVRNRRVMVRMGVVGKDGIPGESCAGCRIYVGRVDRSKAEVCAGETREVRSGDVEKL